MVGKANDPTHENSIIRGCPCFKECNGEQICVNGDEIIDIEFIPIQPELLMEGSLGEGLRHGNNAHGICFQLLWIDEETNKLVCISQGKDVIIKSKLVMPNDLKDAVDILTGGRGDNHAVMCNECLYGVLDSFQSTGTTS